MKNKILIDVGAGAGGSKAYEFFARSAFDKIMLIEPHRMFAAALTEQFKNMPNFSVIPKGLVTSSQKDMSFGLTRPAKWSSFYTPTGLLSFFPSFRVLERESVPIITVQELMTEIKNCEISMRFDCCGNESALVEEALAWVPEDSSLVDVQILISTDEKDFVNSPTKQEIVSLMESHFYDVVVKESERRRLTLDCKISQSRKQILNYKSQLEEAKKRNLSLESKVSKLEAKLKATNLTIDGLQAEVDSTSGFEAVADLVKGLEEHLTKKIQQSSELTVKQVESYMGVQSYFETGKKGLAFHGWPISSQVALHLLGMIEERDYDCIIEFGSGTSTLMFAEALIKKHKIRSQDGQLLLDGGEVAHQTNSELRTYSPSEFDVPKRVVSFEHDKKYFGKTEQLLANQGVQGLVDLVYSPLVTTNVEDQSFLYYSCDAKLKAISNVFSERDARILVLIDGPPQQTGPKARSPALAFLLNHLAQHRLDVFVDDYARKAEKDMVVDWKAMLDARSIQYKGEEIEAEKGAYLIEIN